VTKGTDIQVNKISGTVHGQGCSYTFSVRNSLCLKLCYTYTYIYTRARTHTHTHTHTHTNIKYRKSHLQITVTSQGVQFRSSTGLHKMWLVCLAI